MKPSRASERRLKKMNRPETKGFRSKETHVVDYYEYFRAMSRYADTLESQLKDEKESVNELSRHCQELEAVLHRIFNFGHNNACIFCGFKDRETLKGLGKERSDE